MHPGEVAAAGRPSAASRKVFRGSTLRFVLVLALAAALVIVLQPSAVRSASAQDNTGAQLYAQFCSSCHQPTGLGIEGTFPPLAGNPAAGDAGYVRSAVVDGVSGPIEVLGVRYDTVMPSVAALTDTADIDAVVQYVVELSTRTPSEPEPEPDEEPEEPSVSRGRDLFIGADRFDNGGGACSSCHTAGSVGNLGGWGLGPDLTHVTDSLGGRVGMTGWLSNPPSETMQPIFADNPLTDAEIGHLAAFLDDAPGQTRPSDDVDRLTVAGIVGLLLLVGGMAFAWRGMRQSYVDRLRSTPRPRRGVVRVERPQRIPEGANR